MTDKTLTKASDEGITTSYTDEFAELTNQISTKFGYPYVDLYIQDDIVLGVLITSSKELIEKFMEIEIQSSEQKAEGAEGR